MREQLSRIIKVAKKRRRKRGWLRTLLFFVFVPLIVWFFAFVTWLYWYDIQGFIGREEARQKTPAEAARKTDRIESPTDRRSQERISDEDRRKLEEILKER